MSESSTNEDAAKSTRHLPHYMQRKKTKNSIALAEDFNLAEAVIDSNQIPHELTREASQNLLLTTANLDALKIEPPFIVVKSGNDESLNKDARRVLPLVDTSSPLIGNEGDLESSMNMSEDDYASKEPGQVNRSPNNEARQIKKMNKKDRTPEQQAIFEKFYKKQVTVGKTVDAADIQALSENPKDYPQKSWFCLDLKNPFREAMIKMTQSSYFENFVFFIIFLNSISFIIYDNKIIDNQGNPAGYGTHIANYTTDAKGNAIGAYSLVNDVLDKINKYVFTIVFLFEFLSKVTAMGFYSVNHSGAYINDWWNRLDFIVVITSLIDYLPINSQNLSVIRTARVLRPLKSLNAMPKLRDLVISLLKALPPLGNVVIVIIFLCLMFGILGLQLWSGKWHYRCRLTPLPIVLPPELIDQYRAGQYAYNYNNNDTANLDWFMNFLTNRTEFPFCLNGESATGLWTQTTSPWAHAQDCAWPVDLGSGNISDSLKSVYVNSYDNDPYGVCGDYRPCPGGNTLDGYLGNNYGYCGSNYDDYGNSRFTNDTIMAEDLFFNGDNYGYTTFDSLPDQVIMWFQVLTSAAWSDLMYMTSNFAGGTLSSVYFVTFLFFGANFLINLTVAIILDNFEQPVVQTTFEKEIDRRKTVALMVEALKLQELEGSIVVAAKENIFKRMIDAPLSNYISTLCILVNTVVLGFDQYPDADQRVFTLEWISLILTIIFGIEMLLKLLGYGPRGYLADNMNKFDGFIVTVSLIELGITGTPILGVHPPGGFVSVFRAMRIFRIFKLARSWTSLQAILNTIVKSIPDVSNFMILFFLIMYIFALIGYNIMSNNMHFDKYGYFVPVGYPNYVACRDLPILERDFAGNKCSWIPRNNYDDVFFAMLTVFQIWSTDNWNNVWYDTRRGSNEVFAAIFCISVAVSGMFIMLNIFLSILLVNFADEEGEEEEIQTLEEMAKLKVGILSTIGNSPLAQQFRKYTFNRKSYVQPEVRDLGQILDNLPTPVMSPIGSPSPPGDGDIRDSSLPISPSSPSSPISPPTSSPSYAIRTAPVYGEEGLRLTSPHSPTDLVIKSDSNGSVKKVDSVDSVKKGESNDSQDINRGDSIKSKKSVQSNSIYKDMEEMQLREKLRMKKIEELKNSNCAKCGKELKGCICLKNNSLFILSSTNPFRQMVSNAINNPYFDSFIILMIIGSSLILIIDTPLDDPNNVSPILNGINYFFTIVFTLEMLCKIIHSGLILGEGTYLRSGWNILDCFLVTLAIISLIPTTGSSLTKSLRTLRVFRAFRPLRAISRVQGMKLIVNTLFASIPAVLNVMMVVLLFFFMFSLIGVNFMKGHLMTCSGLRHYPFLDQSTASVFTPEQENLITYPKPYSSLMPIEQSWFAYDYDVSGSSTATGKMICSAFNTSAIVGGSAASLQWVRVQAVHFDNVFAGIAALFQMTTFEEWTYTNYMFMDNNGIDMVPIRDNNRWWAVYNMFYMLFCAYFCKNLIVGAVCDSFDRIKEQLGGTALLTDAQKQWIDAQRIIRSAKLNPLLKRNPKTGLIFDFVNSKPFENFILACIFLNVVAMASSYWGEPATWTQGQEIINYIFSSVFTLEAILKIISYGPKQYFRDSWCLFDFSIVVGADVGIILTLTGAAGKFGGVISIVRIFRVMRVIRLVKSLKGLQKLFDTMILSFPSLANIGFLFFLMSFIFSVVGVELFAKNALNNNMYLTQHSNFQTVGGAFLIMWKWQTGENWDGMMEQMAGRTPNAFDTVAPTANTLNLVGSDGNDYPVEDFYNYTQPWVAPYCDPDPAYDPTVCGFQEPGALNQLPPFCTPINGCGNPYEAYVFGYSFQVIMGYVLLNVFIAVILEQFDENDNKEGTLNKALLELFADIWSTYDPDATRFITFRDFSDMVYVMPPPLGIENMTEKQHRKFLLNLNVSLVKDENGRDLVEFTSVALALGKFMVQQNAESKGEKLEEIDEAILIKTNQKSVLLDPLEMVLRSAKNKGAVKSDPKFNSSHYHATVTIQKRVRERQMIKHGLANNVVAEHGSKATNAAVGFLTHTMDTTKEKKQFSESAKRNQMKSTINLENSASKSVLKRDYAGTSSGNLRDMKSSNNLLTPKSGVTQLFGSNASAGLSSKSLLESKGQDVSTSNPISKSKIESPQTTHSTLPLKDFEEK